MSGEITGVVQEIQTRSVAGGKIAYNIVVGGQSYGAGLYAPKCKEGDYVKFGVDESRGYKNVERGTLKVSKDKPPAEAVAAAAATAPKQTSTGGSVDTRQDIISRQSATNSAIAFLAVAQAADALGLPKTDTKGQRIAALDQLLAKYTQYLYESNTGLKYKDISPSKKDDDEPEAEEAEEAPADSNWE